MIDLLLGQIGQLGYKVHVANGDVVLLPHDHDSDNPILPDHYRVAQINGIWHHNSDAALNAAVTLEDMASAAEAVRAYDAD